MEGLIEFFNNLGVPLFTGMVLIGIIAIWRAYLDLQNRYISHLEGMVGSPNMPPFVAQSGVPQRLVDGSDSEGDTQEPEAVEQPSIRQQVAEALERRQATTKGSSRVSS